MKKILCLVLIIIMIFSNNIFAAQISFTDVENHWAKNEIYKMAEKWVILGRTDGTFGPNENITKTHAFLMFSRLMGFYNKENKEVIEQGTLEYKQELNEVGITQSIEELCFLIKTETISLEDIIEMLENGKEDKELTRLEAAFVFVKLLGDEDEISMFPLVTFEDSDEIPEDFKAHVEYANKIGLMIGYDNYFNPNGYITRAQIATILSRVDDIILKRGIQEKQGLVKNVDIDESIITIAIDGNEHSFELNNKVDVFNQDKRITIKDLEENDFVKIYIDNETIKEIVVYNVETIIYGVYNETIIQDNKQYLILNKDNAVLKYEIIQKELEILKGNRNIYIKDIINGDNVKLVLKNDMVIQIIVGEIKYNVNGSIREIIIGENSFLTIQNLKGNLEKHEIYSETIYDFDGALGNIYDLRLNTDVILTINNKGIEKVKVETLTNIEIITGTVDKLLPKIFVFTIKLDDGQIMMMFLDETETVIKTSTGIAKSIYDIKSGDKVSIYGRYEQDVFYPIQVIINK